MRIIKFALGILCAALVIFGVVAVAMFIRQTVVDALTNDAASALLRRAKFDEPVRVAALHSERQERHPGYASIELIAHFVGLDELPEPPRGKERWTNVEFYAELNRVFPQYTVSRHSNLRNTDFVELIFDTLVAGDIAIVFHAISTEVPRAENDVSSEDEEPVLEWAKRYSVVVGVDLHRDRITLNDPHGFVTRLSLNDFIRATRFEDYDHSLFEMIAFAFRVYQMNTVFIIERSTDDAENVEDYSHQGLQYYASDY